MLWSCRLSFAVTTHASAVGGAVACSNAGSLPIGDYANAEIRDSFVEVPNDPAGFTEHRFVCPWVLNSKTRSPLFWP